MTWVFQLPDTWDLRFLIGKKEDFASFLQGSGEVRNLKAPDEEANQMYHQARQH